MMYDIEKLRGGKHDLQTFVFTMGLLGHLPHGLQSKFNGPFANIRHINTSYSLGFLIPVSFILSF